MKPGDGLDFDEVRELLEAALREDTVVGAGGRALMKWTGVERVLLARDKLAVLIGQLDDDQEAYAAGNFM